MKFGLIHRIMTDLLASLGLLSLLTSGSLAPWMTAGIAIGLVAAVFIPERFQDHPRTGNVGALLSVLLLSGQLARLFLGGDVLELAVEFAASLQVIRLATRRGAAHDQQIILLALVHLVAGTVLGGGLAYGLCFFGFLVVAPGALVLSHLRREVEGNYRQGARDRTGLPVDVPRILRSRRVISRKFLLATCSLSVPIFLFTAILFVLFPRVGLSLLLLGHSRSTRMIGFSDHVDLGGVGKLRTDPTIAMRVVPAHLAENPPVRLALYLRGTAFDQYDGTTWSRTRSFRYPADQQGSTIQLRQYPGPYSDPLQIDLEPISPPVVLLPSDALAFKVLQRGEPVLGRPTPIFVGPENEYKYAGDERGLRYEVYSKGALPVPAEALDAFDRARYLTMPRQLPDRVVQLARTWTQGARSPREIAQAVERHLRSDYRYDLESPSGAAKNPLDHFLFESHRGHCEFYSTAMAVLLRSVGIPTRNVTGFVGGTYNRFGRFYAVRQGDAHSWVEVYLDGAGWVLFDPTPPASAVPQVETAGLVALVRDMIEAAAQRWSRYVVGYDLEQQLRLLRWAATRYGEESTRSRLGARSPLRLVAGTAGVVILLVSAYYLWRRRRTAPPGKRGEVVERLAALQIVALYRSLEAAMAARGVPRVPSTPPLAHAQALEALNHPIAKEVLELTERYVEVRYAGSTLSEEDRREYARRVRLLRQGGPGIGRAA